jgi:hypothetical protein
VAIGAGHQAANNQLKTDFKDDITMAVGGRLGALVAGRDAGRLAGRQERHARMQASGWSEALP